MAEIHDAIEAHRQALVNLTQARGYLDRFKASGSARIGHPYYGNVHDRQFAPEPLERAYRILHGDQVVPMLEQAVEELRRIEQQAWRAAQEVMLSCVTDATEIVVRLKAEPASVDQPPPEAQ